MSTRRKNVLVLDTDAESLIALEQALEEAGFSATTTWATAEAIALLDSEPFDALLVGDHPPEVNSERILKHLREGQRPIPCVVMQSFARHPFETTYLHTCGAAAVVPRWRHDVIVGELRNCLRRPQDTMREAAADEQSSASA